MDAVAASNRDLVKSKFLAFMRSRDPAMIDALFHPDFVDHGAGNGPRTSLASMREDVATHFSRYAELDASLEDIFAEGDRVALRWLMSARDAASGAPLRWAGIAVLRLEAGRIRERWSVFTAPGPP
jgi:ketosteroid isomerase-like protein